jgi:poly-gamma-glutamate synthesis protein (capsule biosynthesis protein)
MKSVLIAFLISCGLFGSIYSCNLDGTPIEDISYKEMNDIVESIDIEQIDEEVMINSIPEVVVNEVQYVEAVEPPTFNIKMTFAGDAMISCYKDQTTSGSFNEYTDKKPPTYFLEKVEHIFKEDDITLVNLENVLSDNKLKEVTKDHNPAYWFKAKTSNTNILTSSGVEAVSLANNHFGDYGQQGKIDTIAAVEKAGLLYGNNDKTFYYEKNGYKIAFICHGLWGEYQADAIIKKVKEAEKESDYQVVFFHGGTEKIHKPEDWKIRAAHKMVDNGADLVIGGHPHVLQPMETYNGVDIVYSLGNFCYGGSRKPENRTVIYQMDLTINNDGKLVSSESNLIPCYVYTGSVNNYQPTPVEDPVIKQKILDFMDWKVNSPV